jgi:hypothetical protein
MEEKGSNPRATEAENARFAAVLERAPIRDGIEANGELRPRSARQLPRLENLDGLRRARGPSFARRTRRPTARTHGHRRFASPATPFGAWPGCEFIDAGRQSRALRPREERLPPPRPSRAAREWPSGSPNQPPRPWLRPSSSSRLRDERPPRSSSSLPRRELPRDELVNRPAARFRDSAFSNDGFRRRPGSVFGALPSDSKRSLSATVFDRAAGNLFAFADS